MSTLDRWVNHHFSPGTYGKSRSMVGVGASLVGVSSVVVRWAWAKGRCWYGQLRRGSSWSLLNNSGKLPGFEPCVCVSGCMMISCWVVCLCEFSSVVAACLQLLLPWRIFGFSGRLWVVVIRDGVVFSCIVRFNTAVKISLDLTCYATICAVFVHRFHEMRVYVWCPSLNFLTQKHCAYQWDGCMNGQFFGVVFF